MWRGLIAIILLHLAGCATTPENPAFPVTARQAYDAITQMQDNPLPLARPLVIIGGYFDFDTTPPKFADYFADLSSHATIVPVSIGSCGSFDQCRDTVIAAVEKACPSSDAQWTSEVDVVGVSLGGLVARDSAAPTRVGSKAISPRRLKIARLFTLSSPLSGAKIMKTLAITDFDRDMKPGSDFLKYLAENDAAAKYQVYAYVHLDDEIVGDRYAAVPNQNPYWLPNNNVLLPHREGVQDERILADISRRLRGERPFTIPPAGPLPETADK